MEETEALPREMINITEQVSGTRIPPLPSTLKVCAGSGSSNPVG